MDLPHSTPRDNPAQAVPWVRLFTEGDALYDEMLRDIRSATSAVRLESYILTSDDVGEGFLSTLETMGEAGRTVIARADYVGSWGSLSTSRMQKLRASGVQWHWSRPWTWRAPLSFNRRNHRKLIVIDDRIAYVGGFNIHRQSSRRSIGIARWRDTHVRLTGPLVQDASALFDRFPRPSRVRWPDFPNGIRLVPNDSHQCRHLLRCAFNAHFQAAQERIWLTTPYFVPDSRTQSSLCAAAKRGVDVRVLVPQKSDVRITTWAAQAAYAHMLRSGVRIWEYEPRMMHAKTIVVDRHWATVRTANFDYRSFFLNDELNLLVDDAEFNLEMAQQFERDLLESIEISRLRWKGRSWNVLVAEAIGWWARRWL